MRAYALTAHAAAWRRHGRARLASCRVYRAGLRKGRPGPCAKSAVAGLHGDKARARGPRVCATRGSVHGAAQARNGHRWAAYIGLISYAVRAPHIGSAKAESAQCKCGVARGRYLASRAMSGHSKAMAAHRLKPARRDLVRKADSVRQTPWRARSAIPLHRTSTW